jgi:hypothetical protein
LFQLFHFADSAFRDQPDDSEKRTSSFKSNAA